MSYRSYVHRHASAEKLTFLDLFAKNTECTRGKIHLGACLLLDLSAKDTAVELV